MYHIYVVLSTSVRVPIFSQKTCKKRFFFENRSIAQSLKNIPQTTYLPTQSSFFISETTRNLGTNSEALSSQQPWNLLGAGILAVARLRPWSFLVDADAAGFGARGRRCCGFGGFGGFWRIGAVLVGSSVSGRGRFRVEALFEGVVLFCDLWEAATTNF